MDLTISPKDLIDIILKLIDQINFYWNFYVFSIIGLLGWLFSLKNPPSLRTKIIVTAGFIAFMVMNVIGLLGTYAFLEATRIEFQAVVHEIPFNTDLIKERIMQLNYEHSSYRVLIIHAVTDIGILIIMWSNILKKSLTDINKHNKAN